MLERLLHSKAAANVSGVALFEDNLHLREIARRANVAPPEAKRELENLVSLSVLKSERRGNQVIFRANEECLFLKELRGLYLKTDGILNSLREALAKQDAVKYAFVYGSFAREEFTERSDLDVLLIGDLEEDALSGSIFRAQKKTSRQINYLFWTEKEFIAKVAEGSGFIKAVLRGEKIWLKGNEDGFERVVKKARN